MTAITYIDATVPDIDYLLWLREATMGEHLINSGISLTPDEQMLRITHLFEQAKIIWFGTQKVGLLKLDEKEDSIEIVQVQIDPKFQGKGLGRQVVEEVVRRSLKQNKKLTLSVLKQNPAKELYLRLGFKITGEDSHSFEMVHEAAGKI